MKEFLESYIRMPFELPLWGNVVAVCITSALVGFIVRDMIEVHRLNKKGKHVGLQEAPEAGQDVLHVHAEQDGSQ